VKCIAQLLARGLAENANNSGISESVLQAKVEAASKAGSVFEASDLVPSSIGLAVIALSVFMDKGASLREKGAACGQGGSFQRCRKSGVGGDADVVAGLDSGCRIELAGESRAWSKGAI